MSDKYIIRNCPAILRMTKICDAYETTRDLPQLCKDCADCVLKRIVELCKAELGSIRTIGKDIMAEEILKLFNIEECE